ncbi:MAG: PBSX family phage terminase large subunit [Clostridiales bacterium]|nr:PBSX family phage terminase large subunit [Clostridiales bacterium]
MTLKKQKIVRISDLIIPKYHRIFNDREHMHHILTSGRAGTKSSYMGIKAVHSIISDDSCSVIVFRKRHNKLRKTVYKEILRAIKRLGLNKNMFKITTHPMQVTYKKNGNTIYFTGSDSVDDTKGIIDEEKPIKLVILDELTEFFDQGEGADELSNIEATFVRGNDEDFRMLYLFNPPKNPNAPIMDWLKNMKERKDTIHLHTDYRDVPVSWLGRKLIETAEAMKALDEKMYNWVWLGLCTGIDELIYYMFSPEIHVYNAGQLMSAQKEAMGEIGVGVDYGQKNATTFQAAGIDYEANCFRGLKEYYHSGRDSGQKSPSEYAQDLKDFCDEIEKEYSRVVSYVFIDPSAAGLKEEARRIMPNIAIVDAKNDVKLGISRVQKFFSFRKLLISSQQKMLIKELGMYQYDEKSVEKGNEVPLKVEDHAADACRYLIMGMWRMIAYMLPATERGENQ